MIIEIRMPQWGMGAVEGVIVRWLKREGDPVQEGEPIAEIDTAKTVGELEAPASGTLSRILKAEGDHAPTGEVLALIETP